MRKGDRGIQPRNWGEKKMVVQDPFLWLKVSVNYLFLKDMSLRSLKDCTGMMSREDLDRWWTVSKKGMY